MENTSTIEEVEKVINKLRPYLNRDGGDIELIDFKDVRCLCGLFNVR